MKLVHVWLVKWIDRGCPEEGMPSSEELVFVADSEAAALAWIRDASSEFQQSAHIVEQRHALSDGVMAVVVDSVEMGVQLAGRRFEQPIPRPPSTKRSRRAK